MIRGDERFEFLNNVAGPIYQRTKNISVERPKVGVDIAALMTSVMLSGDVQPIECGENICLLLG